MINCSDDYKAAIIGDMRRMYIKAVIDLIDPDISYGENTSSGEKYVSDGLIHDKTFETQKKYITCEQDRTMLDGSWELYPDSGSAVSNGFISDTLCGTDGSTNQWVQISFSRVSVLQALSIWFSGIEQDGVAENFTVEVYSGGAPYYTKSVTGNTERMVALDSFTVQNPTAIRVTVTKWSKPNRYVRICEIVPGIYEEWDNDIIAELSINQQIDPSCLSLPYGTATLKMDNLSRRFEPRSKSGMFQSIEDRQGIPLSIGCARPDGAVEYKQAGVYYQHSGGWKTGDNGLSMTWDLVDIIGLLADRVYLVPTALPTTLSGWAQSLVSQLGDNFSARYSVDSAYANIPLTCAADDVSGKKCGDILRWICQATQTFPRADAETGYLCIDPLWSAGRNITLDNMSKYPTMRANDDVSLITVTPKGGTPLKYGGIRTASSNTVSVENPFITTSDQAAALARNILQFYGGNQIILTDRGDPAAEMGDVDRVQLNQSIATNARRIAQALSFSGGVMSDLQSTLLQASGLGMYQDCMIIKSSGSITMPAVNAVHIILVGAGADGQPGESGTWDSAGANGADGFGGKVLAQDIAINSGTSATVEIGTNGGATTLTIADAVYTSADGQYYDGFSDIISGEVYARNGVESPIANSGDGGKGGIGGIKGERQWVQVRPEDSDTPSIPVTEEKWSVSTEPGSGTPGKKGASGCVIIYFEKAV